MANQHFQNGKIYKITSEQTDRIYIGSTCNILSARMSQHRYDNNNGRGNATSREILQYPDAKIELIEAWPCENKQQLLHRERFHAEQNQNICVNNRRPIVEYEERLVENRDYYAANRERINQKFDCADCGGRYTHTNRSTHKKMAKHKNAIMAEAPALFARIRMNINAHLDELIEALNKDHDFCNRVSLYMDMAADGDDEFLEKISETFNILFARDDNFEHALTRVFNTLAPEDNALENIDIDLFN